MDNIKLNNILKEANPAQDLYYRTLADQAWQLLKKEIIKQKDFIEKEINEGPYTAEVFSGKKLISIKDIFPDFRTLDVALEHKIKNMFAIREKTHQPIIRLSFLVPNYNGYIIIKNINDPYCRGIFIHEYVHFLDYLRTGGKGFGKNDINLDGIANKEEAEQQRKKTMKYYNHPIELNAHFQEILSYVDECFKLGVIERIIPHVEYFVEILSKPTTNQQFKEFFIKYFDKEDAFIKFLNDKNYKKFMQRLYQNFVFLKGKYKNNVEELLRDDEELKNEFK